MPEDPEDQPPAAAGSVPEPGSVPPAAPTPPPPPPYPQSGPSGPPPYPQQPQPYPQQPQPYPQPVQPYPQQTQLPSYPQGGGYGPPGGGYPAGGYPTPAYGPVPVGVVSPYASYGARLGGWLLDWLIVEVVGGILEVIFRAANVTLVTIHTTTTTNGVTHYNTSTFSVLGAILPVVIAILYGAIMCGSPRGQTVGMMAVGAKAVDLDTGRPIGFARALGRAAFEYLLFILLVIPWVINMLFPAWDSKSQTLHDKVSRTVVLKSSVVTPG